MNSSNNYFQLIAEFEKNIDWLNQVLKGSSEDSVNIDGAIKPSISKDISDQWAAISAMVQGRVAYKTKAELPSSPPGGVVIAEVWNDPVELNNGLYGWSGSYWEKSPYDTSSTLKFIVGSVDGRVNTVTTEQGLEQAESSGSALVVCDESGNVLMNINDKGHVEMPDYDIESDNDDVTNKSPAFVVVDQNYNALFYVDANGAFHLAQGEEISGMKLANDTVFALVDENLLPCIEIKKDGTVFIPKLINDVEPPKPELPVAKLSWDINHIIVTGQSLSMGADSRPAISVTQPFNNLTFDNGVRSGPTDESVKRAVRSPNITQFAPLTEEDFSIGGETITSGAANYCAQLLNDSNNLYRKKILGTCVGYSGSKIEYISKGGHTASYEDSLIHMEKGKQFASLQNDTYGVSAILFMQGESNQKYDTVDTYYQKLSDFIDDYQKDSMEITGQNTKPVLITYQTVSRKISPDEKIYYNVPQAQFLLARDRDDVFVASPVYPAEHIGTGLHLRPHGTRWLGHYFGKVLESIDRTGTWKPLMPESMIHQGKVILVKFHVPHPPLVFNTSRVPEQTNKGFYVWEGETDAVGHRVPIESVEIQDATTVKIILTREPTVPPQVMYAMDFDATVPATFVGARGNLCDSDPSKSDLLDESGQPYTLENWCVSFIFQESMNNGTYIKS